MYEMKDEYLTGIRQIDEEHTKLFEIAEELYELCNNEFIPDKYDDIVAAVNQLKDYAAFHFAHEEEYMKSIGYKRMFTQVVQHNAFKEKLDEYQLSDIDENSDKVIMELLEFLNDWLINHIQENDKKIGKD